MMRLLTFWRTKILTTSSMLHRAITDIEKFMEKVRIWFYVMISQANTFVARKKQGQREQGKNEKAYIMKHQTPCTIEGVETYM